jgi:hypothetical protein
MRSCCHYLEGQERERDNVAVGMVLAMNVKEHQPEKQGLGESLPQQHIERRRPNNPAVSAWLFSMEMSLLKLRKLVSRRTKGAGEDDDPRNQETMLIY